jgi:hypothetical protein
MLVMRASCQSRPASAGRSGDGADARRRAQTGGMSGGDVPQGDPGPAVPPSDTDPAGSYADGTPHSLTQGHRVDSHVGRPDGGRIGPVDWLFRSRVTGRITVAQLPNAALLVWLAASLLQRLWDPRVGGLDVLRWVSTCALAVWAGDEVLRGVNPFRRLLGAGVLIWTAVSILR